MTRKPTVAVSPPATPIRAEHPALSVHASVAESFSALAGAGLNHLVRNAHAFKTHPNPNSVHQMRVAVRRLRALLSAFRSVLPSASRQRVANDLKRLQKCLGPARDLDVFLDDVLPDVRLTSVRTMLAGAARVPHRRGYARVRAVARGPLLNRVQSGIVTLITALLDASDGKREAQALGRGVLERRHRSLVKRVRGAKDRSDDRLHALRIRIKKLRYAVEFFRPLMPKGGVKAFHGALAEAQDVLGAFNDAVNARALARTLARRADGLDAKALRSLDGIFAAAERRERRQAQVKFTALQTALATPPKRWFR
jgi:triphosphatase